jgi:hypothetical protein
MDVVTWPSPHTGYHWRLARKTMTMHILISAKKVASYRDGREEDVRLTVSKIRDLAAAARLWI